MKKKLLSLWVFLFVGIHLTIAQQVTVTGRVIVKAEGTPLPGVNIILKSDISRGTITDSDGNYQISVLSDGVLVFKFVGMRDVEIPVEGRTQISVEMESETLGMEQVVVVAYGRASKESLTGSVAVIDNAKLTESTETGIDKMLQGAAAGVSVSSQHGAPGSGAKIRIRGIGSINAGQEPLIVIDGIPTNSNDASTGEQYWGGQLALLNPDDIESITVLKDASSAALYGSRAANGVILITTRSGKAGKGELKVNIQGGISSYGNNEPMLTSDELWQLQYEGTINAGDYYNDPAYYDPDDPSGTHYLDPALKNVYTNWWDEVVRTSQFKKIEVSAGGGNEKTKFYVSGSYTDEEGAIITTGFDRLTTRINVDHEFNDKLTFGTKLNASYGEKDWFWADNSYSAPINGALFIFPWRTIYNEDGSFSWNMPENGDVNTVAHLKESPMRNNSLKLIGDAFLQYKITPDLSVKLTASADNLDLNEEQYLADDHHWAIFYLYQGWLKKSNIRETKWYSSALFNYHKIFGDHGIDVIVGAEREKFIRKRISSIGMNIPKDKQYFDYATTQLGGMRVEDFIGEWALQSYLSRVNYNFKRKYYASLSYRRDGSSRFGTDNKYGNFFAIGTSWRISEEDFFNVPFVDNLKLSMGYGTSGNDKINYYDAYGTYSALVYSSNTTFVPQRLPNPDLRWEKSATTNISLDFGLFSRITGRLEVFNKETRDMLFDVPISPTSGFNQLRMNAGKMQNTGFELQLSSTNVNTGDFKWNTDFTYYFFKNKVTDLVTSDTLYTENTRIHIKGQPYQQFYLHDFAGVDPGSGYAMWYDENGNITFNKNEARDIIAGSPYPDFEAGLTNTISYKGLSLSAFFFLRWGNEIFTFYQRYGEDDNPFMNTGTKERLDRWQKPGDVTSVPKPIKGNPTRSSDWDNERWASDGSFLRLKDLTLSYTLPKSLTQKMKMSGALIYLKGQNIWTLHKSHNFDPEVDYSGYIAGLYPLARTFTAGIKLNF